MSLCAMPLRKGRDALRVRDGENLTWSGVPRPYRVGLQRNPLQSQADFTGSTGILDYECSAGG